MKGKLLGLGIVVFWAATMAALVRVEYSEQLSPWDEVPVPTVLLKVLGNPDPLRFTLHYQNQEIGFASAEFVPIHVRTTDASGRTPAYRVQADLNLTMSFRSEPVRVSIATESVVTRRLDVARARVRGNIGATQFEASTAASNGALTVSYDLGDGAGAHRVDWNEAAGMAWARSLGVPAAVSRGREITKAYHGRYNIAGTLQRAYLVETRVSDAMWARLWVDESGAVLLAETSAGITLRSDVLAAGGSTAGRARRPGAPPSHIKPTAGAAGVRARPRPEP